LNNPQVVPTQTNWFAYKLCHTNAHTIWIFPFVSFFGSTTNDRWIVKFYSKYPKELFNKKPTYSTIDIEFSNTYDYELYYFIDC
jgi:hypothetical protein